MRCLFFAAALGLIFTFVFNALIGIIAAGVLYFICRLSSGRNTDTSDAGLYSTSSSTSNTSQQDDYTGNGGLFGGAGASAGWVATEESASDSSDGDGGGDGGGGD